MRRVQQQEAHYDICSTQRGLIHLSQSAVHRHPLLYGLLQPGHWENTFIHWKLSSCWRSLQKSPLPTAKSDKIRVNELQGEGHCAVIHQHEALEPGPVSWTSKQPAPGTADRANGAQCHI
uniref:Uncharacterized protein n=1 Tax=Knipowitschia caucasica TaxID=637954 RepID=A0AAV2JJS7_KNICA